MRIRRLTGRLLLATTLLTTTACGSAHVPTATTTSPAAIAVSGRPSRSTAPAAHSTHAPRATPPGRHLSRPARGRDLSEAEAFVRFAHSPGASTLADLGPAPSGIRLGLASRLLTTLTVTSAADPASWRLDPGDYFRGSTGGFSALDLLKKAKGPLKFGIGPHAHCAGPPVPAPPIVAGLRDLSIQPNRMASCLDWFTVDLFVDAQHRLVAVTLDLWEP